MTRRAVCARQTHTRERLVSGGHRGAEPGCVDVLQRQRPDAGDPDPGGVSQRTEDRPDQPASPKGAHRAG